MSPASLRASTSVRRAWAGLVVVLAVVWLAAVAPPWLEAGARAGVTGFFAPVCHQIPGRSVQVDGVALALCHRCFGIFSGLLLAAALFWLVAPFDGPIMRRSRVVLIAALAVVGVDWLVDVVGLWSNTPVSRSATGLVFGAVAGYFLARGIVDLARGSDRTTEPGDQAGETSSSFSSPVS